MGESAHTLETTFEKNETAFDLELWRNHGKELLLSQLLSCICLKCKLVGEQFTDNWMVN